MVEIYFHRSVGVKQGCVVLAYVRLRSVWPDAIFGVFRILFVRGAFHSRHFRIQHSTKSNDDNKLFFLKLA
jgi:hypothetical protein